MATTQVLTAFLGLEIAIGSQSQGLDKRTLVTLYDTESTTLSTISTESEPLTTQNMRGKSCKNVQSPGAGVILLGILKSVEQELRTRELVGDPAQEATPLWFIAETERNVYLWRNGKSIDDRAQFTFWVDINALIAKRREQLRRNRGFNPFINSMANSGGDESRGIQVEHQYLDCLEDLSGCIFKHAETLSHASEGIRLELSPSTAPRTTVTLPIPPRGPAALPGD